MSILSKVFIVPMFIVILAISIHAACTSYGNPSDSGVDAEEHTNGDPGNENSYDCKPPGDYVYEIPVEPAYCPENLANTHPPVVVEYYGESGVLPKDTYETTWDVFVAATWEGVRRLSQPYQLDCLEDFITDPPGLPCSAETVLDLRLQDGSLLSFLLGIEASDIEAIPAGTAVEYATPFGWWDNDIWGIAGINIIIRRASDKKILLVAMGWDKIESYDRICFGPVAVEMDDDFICGYKTYMNCKHYAVSAISLLVGEDVHRLEPGESIVVSTDDGDYRVTHRLGKVRTCYDEEGCCGDDEKNRFSYSIVVY